MNKKETAVILDVLKTAYPRFYNGFTEQEALGVISMWSMQFADMPADIVLMALNKAISTSKFPPTIAELKDNITAIHWEAYMSLYMKIGYSQEEKHQLSRIIKATERYSSSKSIALTVSDMLENRKEQMNERLCSSNREC